MIIKETPQGYLVGDVLVTYDLRCSVCNSNKCQHVRKVKAWLRRRGRLVYVYYLPSNVVSPKPTVVVEGKPAYISVRPEIVALMSDGTERKIRGKPAALRYITAVASP
ncbi:MAG: hypothetical protein QXU93_11610, partial [Thermoproteus sp.]